MNDRRLLKTISQYLLYVVLLTSWLIVQTHLKVLPQLTVLSIAALVIFFYHSSSEMLYRVFSSVFLSILVFCLTYLTLNFLWHSINPYSGFHRINGRVVRTMDLSGVVVGFVSFLLATLYAAAQFRRRRTVFRPTEYYLALAALILSSVVFIRSELT